jgi:hypothetical protein
MGTDVVTSALRPFLAAVMLLLTAGQSWGQVSFELLDAPDRGRWADFSLSRDGKNMGCLLGGAVYWWTAADGFRFLDEGSPNQGGVGMSATGNALIAAREIDGGTVPTIWFLGGSTVDIGFLADECRTIVHADLGYDLNADGTMAVGQSTTCDAATGFVWTRDQGLLGLPHGLADDSRASAVSADGRTVVGFCDHPVTGFRRPALWRDGQGPILFLGPDRAGEALNISLNGGLVVGQAEMGGISPQAFLWVEGNEPVGLGNLSGKGTDASLASAVSDDGKVVGWSGDELWSDQEAFIWTAQAGMRSLAGILAENGVDIPEGLNLTGALDISGDGITVVGVGRDQAWNQRYWRIRLDRSLDHAPVAVTRPWNRDRVVPASPDSIEIHRAEVLHPFPFGKRRY